jgi:L-cysteate sulfo-lyase
VTTAEALDQVRHRLAALPRVSLAHLPTPIERWDRLSEWLGGPTVWAKRDDLTGLGLGGNKVRKLEFLLGEALAQGADVVLATGVVQSNHARQTAAAAAKLGIECRLLLASNRVARSDTDYTQSGNVLLDRLFEAEIELVSWEIDLNAALEALADRLRRQGRKPYVVPYGGSTPTGAMGYAAFVVELIDQLDSIPFGHLVLASGSGGTQGGIVAAAAALAPHLSVLGIDVDAEADRVANDARHLAEATAERLGVEPGTVEVVPGFAGPGYGVVTESTVEAIRTIARLEGAVLDPVYSGKAMAGLIGLVRQGRLAAGEDVLFLHTGGVPALFAYRPVFSE